MHFGCAASDRQAPDLTCTSGTQRACSPLASVRLLTRLIPAAEAGMPLFDSTPDCCNPLDGWMANSQRGGHGQVSVLVVRNLVQRM